MTLNIDPVAHVGQYNTYHGALGGADVDSFNSSLSQAIRKTGSETYDTSTSGFENLFSTTESNSADLEDTIGAEQIQAYNTQESTWSVDQENNTIRLDNGYEIVINGEFQTWQIKDAEGNETSIGNYSQVLESDGGHWVFRTDMSFMLKDGTKITVQTKDWIAGYSVSDNLIITNGDNCVQVTGLGDGQPVISEVMTNGQEMDDNTYDGYIVNEMGGGDDWSWKDDEIISDLPFLHPYTHHNATMFRHFDLFSFDQLDVAYFSGLDVDIEQSFFENGKIDELHHLLGDALKVLNERFDDMEAELSARLNLVKEALEHADRKHDINFYQDYVTALEGDLKALNSYKGTGSVGDKAQFLNNLHSEASIEMKYNIVLTHETELVWSEQDLAILDTELGRVPLDFSLFNPQLSSLRIEDLPPGVAARNSGADGLLFDPGNVDSLVHEIGHYYDESNENPRFEEFKEISGWQDVTSWFSSISNDYVDGEYSPHEGNAVLERDERTYNDGDAIDLDGDGQVDGIVQVNYGKVMIHDQNATFARPYGGAHLIEDFATTFEMFFLDPFQLLQNAPEKYDFMVAYTGIDPDPAANIRTLSTDNDLFEELDRGELYDIVD